MANEIQVRISVTVRKGNLQYTNQKSAYSKTMTGTKGMSPGLLTIPTGGKVVLFNELFEPGQCVITNIDDKDSTKYVQWGMYDPDTSRFYPVGELGPGEVDKITLSRDFREEWIGTGTGTSGPSSYFFMKAFGGDVPVTVEACER